MMDGEKKPMPGEQMPDGQGPLAEVPVACLELDLEGRIRRVNQAACELLGFEALQLLGEQLCTFMPPEHQEGCDQQMGALEAGQYFNHTYRRSLRTHDNRDLLIDVYNRAFYDEAGEMAGVRAALVDVTLSSEIEHSLLESQHWLQSVLRSIQDAVVVIDSLGRIKLLSGVAESLLGWSAQELFETDIEDVLQIESAFSASSRTLTYRTLLSRPWSGMVSFRSKRGERLSAVVASNPIADENSIMGTLLVLRTLQAKTPFVRPAARSAESATEERPL